MRAYQNIKFIEGPDVLDIQIQGRKSSIGKIKRGRGYCGPQTKAAIRRYLKHVDRAISAKFEKKAEGV